MNVYKVDCLLYDRSGIIAIQKIISLEAFQKKCYILQKKIEMKTHVIN